MENKSTKQSASIFLANCMKFHSNLGQFAASWVARTRNMHIMPKSRRNHKTYTNIVYICINSVLEGKRRTYGREMREQV